MSKKILIEKEKVVQNSEPTKIVVSNSEKPKRHFWKKFQGTMQRMSGALLFPIAVLPIAGLLLGIGGAMGSLFDKYHVTNPNEYSFASDFVSLLNFTGSQIFQFLPLLFGVSIAITFTNDIGTVAIATIFMFLAMSGAEAAFVNPLPHPTSSDPNPAVTGYDILFYKNVGPNTVTTQLFNVQIVNTSIFGGIVIGFLTSFIHKRSINIKVPNFIGFFSGARLVSIFCFLAGIALAFVFLIVWPPIGLGLNAFGHWSSKLPYGTDSLIFGFIERSLIPFGLHHAFYFPLWQTSAGGELLNKDQLHEAYVNYYNSHGLTLTDAEWTNIWQQWTSGLTNGSGPTGDQQMTFYVDGLPFSNAPGTNEPIFDFLSKYDNLNLGRFMGGKYIFMIFGLTAAGFAMIMAADKDKKKLATSLIGSSILTVFLTGITEPIEFTFLFLAPALFWGFHSVMAGIAFMLANIMGTHVGTSISGGLLDLTIFGALPVEKGTHFYWLLAVGPVYSVIYYFVFYFWIKKFNLATPGRGEATKLFSKADYKAKSEEVNSNASTPAPAVGSKAEQDKELTRKIIMGLGGKDNINTIGNCASRLRVNLKDGKKVDKDLLKETKSFGVVVSGNDVQVIYGPIVSQIRASIKKNEEI